MNVVCLIIQSVAISLFFIMSLLDLIRGNYNYCAINLCLAVMYIFLYIKPFK